jgi:serine/threonine protein phosphatase 1
MNAEVRMQYVISDIHGCLAAFRSALKAVHFSSRDTLYLLGDVIDRGEDPLGVLEELMMMDNAIPILGNHEYIAMQVLPVFASEITEESIASLSADDLIAYANWSQDGGDITMNQFQQRSREQQEAILDYLMEFSLYEEVSVRGRDYVLVHAGLSNFSVHRPLDDYAIHELIFERSDPQRIYYPDKYIVSGHVPTLSFADERRGRIVEANRQILIDCGCVFGGALGIYCLDNGQKTYISRKGDILI